MDAISKKINMKNFITTALLLCSALAYGQTVYVSPNGNDANDGSAGSPKATLAGAFRAIRALPGEPDLKDGQKVPSVSEPKKIVMASGEYNVYEPIFVRPEDSDVVVEGNGAVISGGVKIGGWKKHGKLLVADVPDFCGRPFSFRQLYVNGKKAVRARDVDDFDKMARVKSLDKPNQILYVPATPAIKKLKQSGVGYAEMVLHEMWCVANLRIKSIEIKGDSAAVTFHQPESKIQFEHPWPCPMITTDGHNSAFYLTNSMALLDKPGEWFHDIKSNKLYYYPKSGEVVKEAVVPAVETLLRVEGTIDSPVKNVVFKNLTFSHSTWMRPTEKGHVPLQAGMYLTDAYKLRPSIIRPDRNHKLDNQGWLGRPASAVVVKAASGISFEECAFAHLGSSGIDYEWATEGGNIIGCTFDDIAGNGIVAGSFSPEAFETHQPYDPSDGREVCRGLNIVNNKISDVTNEDWGTLGICAGFVRDVVIAHNEISEVSYSGINLGWGWTQSVNCMRGNEVYRNVIHHYAKHMYDCAGIYTLGAQPKTFVTGNVVYSIYHPSYAHDPNHWFYLYTDEGSSFITLTDNWTEGDKFLKNATGPGNVWENNGPEVSDSIKSLAGIRKNIDIDALRKEIRTRKSKK